MTDTTTEPPATGDTTDANPELGDAGKKALSEERAARRAAEKQAKELADRLREIEDRDKSDQEKAAEKVAAAEKAAADAEQRALRAEVAMAKGLTAAQAKRLVGSTAEELEADADEILEAFPAKPAVQMTRKPVEALRGGGDPTEEPEETDPRKLAEFVPRP